MCKIKKRLVRISLIGAAVSTLATFSCEINSLPTDLELADTRYTLTEDLQTLTCGDDRFELHVNENFDDAAAGVEGLLNYRKSGSDHRYWRKMTWFNGSTSGLEFKEGNLIFNSFRGKPEDDCYSTHYPADSEYANGGGFLNGAIYFESGEPYGYYETRMKFNPRQYSGGWGCYYAYWHNENGANVYEYDFVEEHDVDEFDVTTHWQTANRPVRRSLTWGSSKNSLFETMDWKTVGQWHKVGFLWTDEKCAIYLNDQLIYVFYEDNRNGKIPASFVRLSREADYPLISNREMMFLMVAASGNATTADSWVPGWTGYPTLDLFGNAPADYNYPHLEVDYFRYYKWQRP